MKTTRTETVTVDLCDYCQGECSYPYVCADCGKQACNQCWLQLVSYEIECPFLLETRGGGPNFGTGVQRDEVRFCKECYDSPTNKLVPVLKKITECRDELVAQYRAYRLVVDKLTWRANEMISKRKYKSR